MGDHDVGPSRAVTEVEFVARDCSYPFVQASNDGDCVVAMAEMLPRGEDRFSEFFTVEGAPPATVAETVSGRDGVDVTVLREDERNGLVELVVSESCPAVQLAQLGACPQVVRGVEGRGRVTADVPARTEDSTVLEPFLDRNPEFTLTRKRRKDAVSPRFTTESFRRIARENLTERQREVVRTAYEAGYYDWPRQCSGREVAEDLGITSATFSQHVQAAERKILTVLFDEAD